MFTGDVVFLEFLFAGGLDWGFIGLRVLGRGFRGLGFGAVFDGFVGCNCGMLRLYIPASPT